jgi:hypothetical protein
VLSIHLIPEVQVNIKHFRVWCERGQALAEYMPTMAGAMAVSVVIWLAASNGVKGAYCKAVDAFTDLPKACEDQGLPSGSGGGDEGGGGGNELPPEPQVEPSCGITLSSAPGTDPKNWNTEWDGSNDVLTVAVSDMTAGSSVPWTLKLRFPTDPSSKDTVINSGVFTENGTYHLTVPYPAKGSWGPVSQDGYGTYESHATLNIAKPCGDVGWDRWYKAPFQADVAISISKPTKDGSTYSYTTTVTNNGPWGTQVYNGQGVTINTRIPSTTCTTITQVVTSQGVCETQESCNCGSHVICDFGALGNGQSAVMTVYFTKKTEDCSLFGETKLTNNSPKPPDPNKSNNSANNYVQP